MRKFIVGGILLVLTSAATYAQDYDNGGGYEAPPPAYGYRAPAPAYGYRSPPPAYGYAPPRHCHIVYTNYGPRRVCPRYAY